MKKSLWLASTALVAVALATSPAYAGGKTKQDTRDQEIQELKARLERLEQDNVAEKQAAEDEKIANGARLAKVEQTQDAVQWTFADGRPSVRSGDGRFELAFRGRVQLDWASFMQDQNDFALGYGAAGACAATNVLCDLGSGANFRRVRFGVEGKFFRDFIYELRFDFGGTDVEGNGAINIARVGYVGIPGLRIQAGAMQPIFSLYDSTSSAELTTMERPAIITSVVGNFGGDNSRRGVEVTYQQENMLWDGSNFLISGAFTGNRTTSQGGCQSATHSGGPDDECTQLIGRTALRLWSDGVSNVQIGASGAQTLSLQGQTTVPGSRTMRFRERPEVRVTGERFIDTGDLSADGASLFGYEFGANWENFYVAAEYYNFEVDRPGALMDPEYSGWYVEGEWIFTGENKRYVASGTNNNIAVWRGPSVTSPWSLGGGLGAFSLSARYSTLDLNFNEGAGAAVAGTNYRGGEQTVTNIGLNWYLNSNLKLMTEYSMVDIERMGASGLAASSLDAEFDIVQGRMQFTF